MHSFLRRPQTLRKATGRVAILAPTYRFDARARHSLACTASLASEDVAVLIADNSESVEKRKYLDMLARLNPNIHVFQHKRNIGAFPNWLFLLEQSTIPLYLFVSDDDFCTPLYVETGLRLLDRYSDSSAASGSVLLVTSGNSMVAANGERLDATAYERCTNFTIGGGNSLPNCMARHDAVRPFRDYVRVHPLRASFFDWFMSYSILARGKYYREERGSYFYDLSNWETPESCWQSNAKFYAAAGLPASFTWFHELYWAVESVNYFAGKYSPILDEQESRRCANYFYLNRLQQFRRVWRHAPLASVFSQLLQGHPNAREAVEMLVRNDDDEHPHLFAAFSELLSVFDSLSAIAYSDFVASSRHTVVQSDRNAATTVGAKASSSQC